MIFSTASAQTTRIETPAGEAVFLALASPDMDSSTIPLFKAKLSLSLDDGRQFYAQCRDIVRDRYPGAKKPILPVYKTTNGLLIVAAETLRTPRIIGAPSISKGDQVRLIGRLSPFERNGRQGANLRLEAVEAVARS